MAAPLVTLKPETPGDWADIVLDGIEAPWPEDPDAGRERRGSSMQMIAGKEEGTAGNVLPGRVVGVDMGTHESAREFDLSFVAVQATRDALEVVYDTVKSFKLEVGAKRWAVRWRPQTKALDARPEAGFPGYFRVALKLNAILREA